MARTRGQGNPNWTWDETILALDLYFECAGEMPSGEDARVRQLSELLRRMPYHSAASRKASFRNPDGVAFKLQNIRQVATGKGLGNVSEMDRKVWSEFGSQPEKVKRLADLIRAGVNSMESLPYQGDGDEEDEFFEGRVLTNLHKKRERDRNLRKRLLASRRGMGKLTCDICQIFSNSVDPKMEDAIFEAHHLMPLSMSVERKTRLADVVLLCANCHRLLHRAISFTKRWLNLSEGREIIGVKKTGQAI